MEAGQRGVLSDRDERGRPPPRRLITLALIIAWLKPLALVLLQAALKKSGAELLVCAANTQANGPAYWGCLWMPCPAWDLNCQKSEKIIGVSLIKRLIDKGPRIAATLSLRLFSKPAGR